MKEELSQGGGRDVEEHPMGEHVGILNRTSTQPYMYPSENEDHKRNAA